MEATNRGAIQEEISLPRLYRTLSRRWWWLPAAIFLGGVLGLALSFVLKAQFRATASLGVGIDLTRSLPLNRAAERAAMLRAQGLALADQTLQDAIDRLPASLVARNGIEGPADLRARVRLDQYEGRWDLSVRSSDPVDAAEMANEWARSVVENLKAAQVHAVRAQEIQGVLYGVGCELVSVNDTGRTAWQCGAQEDPPGDLAEELVEEVRASKGILPALTYALLREANPPEQPVYRGRLALLAGGALVGVALALALAFAVPES